MSFGEDVTELVERSRDPLVAKAMGWPRVPLGDVAEILNGFPWKSDRFTKTTGAPLIRIRDVTTGETETYYNGPITEGYWVEHGDLLVGMDGDFNVRRWHSNRGLLNQRVCKITPDANSFDARLLEYMLPGYLRLINQATSSVTVKHLSSRTLAELPLPLPPLAEQRRIIAKLDVLTARLTRARAELDRVPVLANNMREIALANAFDGLLIDEGGAPKAKWTTVPFAEAGEIASNLVAPSTISDLPHIAPNHIPSGRPVLLPYRTIGEDKVISGKHRFHPGQIIYSKIRPNLRKVVLVDFEGGCSADMYPINANCHTRYLLYWMLSPQFTWLATRQEGRTILPKINQNGLNAISTPLAPRAVQERIAAMLDQIFARADRLEAEATRACALLDRLESTLLAKAFRGELVPQDPNDEPAQALLDRIRAQRAAAPRAQRRRRRAQPEPTNA